MLFLLGFILGANIGFILFAIIKGGTEKDDDFKDKYYAAQKEEADRYDKFCDEMGELLGYTVKECVFCGRCRVEKFSTGVEVCEKCGTDQKTGETYRNKYGSATEFYY